MSSLLVGALSLAWPSFNSPARHALSADGPTLPSGHTHFALPLFNLTLMGAVTFTRVPASTPSFISLPGPNARTASADRRAGAGARVGAAARRLVQDCIGVRADVACVRAECKRRARSRAAREERKRGVGGVACLQPPHFFDVPGRFPFPSLHTTNGNKARHARTASCTGKLEPNT